MRNSEDYNTNRVNLFLKEKERIEKMIQVCDRNIICSRYKKKGVLFELRKLLKVKETVEESPIPNICRSNSFEKQKKENYHLCKKRYGNRLFFISFRKIEKIKNKQILNGTLKRKSKNQRSPKSRSGWILDKKKKERRDLKRAQIIRNESKRNDLSLYKMRKNLPLFHHMFNMGVLQGETRKRKVREQSKIECWNLLDCNPYMAFSTYEKIEKDQIKYKNINNEEAFVIKEIEGMLKSFFNVWGTFFSLGIKEKSPNGNFHQSTRNTISKLNQEEIKDHQKKEKRKKKPPKKEICVILSNQNERKKEESTNTKKKELINKELVHLPEKSFIDFALVSSINKLQKETKEDRIVKHAENNQMEINITKNETEEKNPVSLERVIINENKINGQIQKVEDIANKEDMEKEEIEEEKYEKENENEIDYYPMEENNNYKINEEKKEETELKEEEISTDRKEEDNDEENTYNFIKNECDIKQNNSKLNIQENKGSIQDDSTSKPNHMQVEIENIKNENFPKDSIQIKKEKGRSEQKLEKTKKKKKKEKKDKRKKDSKQKDKLPTSIISITQENLHEEKIIKNNASTESYEQNKLENSSNFNEGSYESLNMEKTKNEEIQTESVNIVTDSNRRETNLNAKKIIDFIKNIDVGPQQPQQLPIMYSSTICNNDELLNEEEKENKEVVEFVKESNIIYKDKKKKRKKEKEEGNEEVKEKNKKKDKDKSKKKKKSKDRKKEEEEEEEEEETSKKTVDIPIENKKENTYLTVYDTTDIIKETIFDIEKLEYKTSDNDMVKDIMNEYCKTPQLTSLYETLYQKKDKDFPYVLK